MKKLLLIPFAIIATILYARFFPDSIKSISDERFQYFIADLKKDKVEFFLRDKNGEYFNKFLLLNKVLRARNKELTFATNAGMFMTNYLPLGLYIENKKIITPINKKAGNTNFYLKPNGILYITKENSAQIVTTEKYKPSSKIKYATQSGPMLLIDGKINKQFKKASLNLNIRSGVGIMKNGEILFAISKIPVSFFDFAEYFKRSNCANALFLDGGISEFYYPDQGMTDNINNFGPIIAVVK